MAEYTANKKVFGIVFVSSVIDLTASTLLFSHVTEIYQQMTRQIKFFDFSSSLFEFWCFSFLRTCFLLGFLIGVYANGSDEGMHRLRALRIPIVILNMFFWVFGIIKMLIYTENTSNFMNKSSWWFWCQFAWAEFASFWFYICYILLKNFGLKKVDEPEGQKYESVNSTVDERQNLLDRSDGEETESSKKSEEQKKTTKEKASSILRLIVYSKPDLPYLSVAFIFMVLSAVAEIFTPWYTGQVIQGIAIDKSKADFTRAIIFMSLFSAGSAISAGIRGGFFKVAMARLNIRIRNLLFSSLVKQEVGFFDTTKTGDMTSRLTSDTTTMSDALSLNFNVFVRSIIKTVGVCVFMFKLSWRLSMVTIIGLPIIMVISKLYGEYYEMLSKKVQDSLALANEVAEEVCSSMRTVHSFANEDEESLRYSQRLDVTYQLKIKESFAYAGYMWSNQLFSLSLVVSILYYGGHLVVNEMMSGGELVSFILYQMELGYALESISNVYTGLMQAIGASEKVFEYIDRKPTIAMNGNMAPDKLDGRLEFKNVTFSYPGRPDSSVLENVSFKVEPGEVVALVGPSGSGKSSCVNLLEHFYETKSGLVLLDDIPINQYDHKYLHRKIALVGQEPVLYACSIKENIAYGLDFWDIEQVKQAAIQANAHNFIADMKDQYDTDAGEKGAQLSGGQKQRIAIARAIIRNPTVLLLDEATSALDSESEHIVQQAIYSNIKGRTVIVIAHRLSTVEKADRIIVINKGRIIEQGTHAELLRRTSGMYHRLVQRQMLGFEIGGADQLTGPLPLKCNSAQDGLLSRRSRSDDLDCCNSSTDDLYVTTNYGSLKSGSLA